ncbi:MAG: hydrogenase expression/formation protein [Limimaricola sp.]|uniref:hydrogenase expression/formation C-terminal domain-containing protein n=1 Tax=Limimaricola sp. TaxID=2211665 RepID=UPI001D1EDF0D|nr:hydrogenase expression/formation C-terminal domain-containing protein [Limimaricola sp.]MBI1418935.1 hydrogenase expression/formation protein [Limimaricola sp.]
MAHDAGTGAALTGMVDSLMQEVARALTALAETGTRAAIDLRSLPLTPADRDQLAARLGRGEVAATLDVGGRTEVWETAYAGVWWQRHLGAGDHVAGETLEITPLPDILQSHADDIAAAALRLARDLHDTKETADA